MDRFCSTCYEDTVPFEGDRDNYGYCSQCGHGGDTLGVEDLKAEAVRIGGALGKIMIALMSSMEEGVVKLDPERLANIHEATEKLESRIGRQ